MFLFFFVITDSPIINLFQMVAVYCVTCVRDTSVWNWSCLFSKRGFEILLLAAWFCIGNVFEMLDSIVCQFHSYTM